ncbi:transcriptional regulator BetI [Lutimaribacter sp. EGI FJ00015]|uniref:Transcriptional regulator BetI n=1 Tax=Lutimaribacter degradans TaxID=2945989 RepID=A0ACC5ZQU7_9RHOB|nr:transcriptional regulator BetI [Lutimaribacter sp. EGI FJ00013]MCM2560533.1 transcriptional regulator BetI [Lutimaribacter sp. EGI FJ00013]MCO0612523.1 transcriptional regulator BetI [Lutimaribacter sp. EGI FJ00015]MCO0634357.1 transcriptional regulator BetI [Lutimaribacter sp. EGI FJ00014]
MPKLGMEPIRREALVKATIAEIGVCGTLDVSVAQIARRAGMSSALAHHYLGGKEQILVAAMRYTMGIYAAEVRGALAMAATPAARVEAIVRASFSPRNFRTDTVAAWMNFYVLARRADEAQRLLVVYQRRLRTNLCHALRPAIGGRAEPAADRIAALVDGVYLQQSLGRDTPDSDQAVAQVLGYLELELERAAS